MALASLASLFAAVALAMSYSPMTPYDEQAHFDYVARLVTEHRLFPVGEIYSQTTLDEITCRGIGLEKNGEPRTVCGPQLSKTDLPFEGVNYVAGYSPVFYVATALVAGPLSSITGISLFLASRLVCAVWFAAGAGLLTWALIRLGAKPGVAAAGSILMASTPAFLLQGGAVTADSTSLMAGAGSLFIMTLRTTWRRRLGWATVFGVLAGLVKSSFIPVATFVVLMAMVFPIAGGEPRARWRDLSWRRLTGGLVLASLPVLAQAASNAWRSASLASGASADGGMNDILPAAQSVGMEIVLGGIQLLQPLESVVYINPAGWVAIAVLVQTILIGGTVVLTLQPYLPVGGIVRTTAFAAIGAFVLAVIFLPVTFFVLFHVQATQGRYALPVMPLFLAAVVLAIKDVRGGGWLVGAVAAVGWSVALSAVLAS